MLFIFQRPSAARFELSSRKRLDYDTTSNQVCQHFFEKILKIIF